MEIKKEYTGLIWNIPPNFPRNKKTSSAVFSPFCKKKARSSLEVQLEKFVRTKTHLAVKVVHFFQNSEKHPHKIIKH